MVLRLRMNPPDWSKGKCHDDVKMDRSLSSGKHYDDDAQITGHEYPDDALEECNNIPCPIREQCLLFALVNNEQYGVWGGADESQRMYMRRRISKEEWEWDNLPPRKLAEVELAIEEETKDWDED